MVAIWIKVEISSAPGKPPIPVSFTLHGRTFLITRIIDIWHGADHAYYKFNADDGNLYLIRHDLNANAWELVMMEVTTG